MNFYNYFNHQFYISWFKLQKLASYAKNLFLNMLYIYISICVYSMLFSINDVFTIPKILLNSKKLLLKILKKILEIVHIINAKATIKKSYVKQLFYVLL